MAIYADFLAGKFKNITEARKAAGQIKVKTALEKLEQAWTEASATERDTFKMRIGCTATTGAPTTISAPGGGVGSPSTLTLASDSLRESCDASCAGATDEHRDPACSDAEPLASRPGSAHRR